jgi:glyoxylase-like metal-dependent hydrolase (beta-lactamase superfamily II)
MDVVKQLVESRPDFFAGHCAGLNVHLERAVRINDFIHMSYGSSNAYMVVTTAGRVIINTGMGYEAPVHKKLFDAVCPGPTPFILLTQGHVDHVGGVRHFREPGTQLIAQRNNGACQRDDERIKTVRIVQAYIWFKETIDQAGRLAARPPELFTPDVPTPDITFDDHHRFALGGIEFEILSAPGGETIDSCVVWLPRQRILFSGNVFGPLFPHFPNINTIRGDKYRFIEPYLDSLRRIRALEPELLITGHFDPIAGAGLIRQCLDRLEAAVDYVHRETLNGMNAGKDIWTLMREVQLPPELYVGEAYGKVSWAVRTIWESYMGWFKAQATSELYPTQPSDVYKDLVALAGIEAVIERGRAKLRAGDPESALLLAEAALAYDRATPPALQLSLDAHHALLARSRAINFWETGWLRTQIGKLEAALGRS